MEVIETNADTIELCDIQINPDIAFHGKDANTSHAILLINGSDIHVYYIQLRKGKALRKHSLQGDI